MAYLRQFRSYQRDWPRSDHELQPGWPMPISSALFYHFFLVICVLAPLALDHSPKFLTLPPSSEPLHTAWEFLSCFLLFPGDDDDYFFRSGLQFCFLREDPLSLQMRCVSVFHLLCTLRFSHVALVLVFMNTVTPPLFWKLKQERGPQYYSFYEQNFWHIRSV